MSIKSTPKNNIFELIFESFSKQVGTNFQGCTIKFSQLHFKRGSQTINQRNFKETFHLISTIKLFLLSYTQEQLILHNTLAFDLNHFTLICLFIVSEIVTPELKWQYVSSGRTGFSLPGIRIFVFNCSFPNQFQNKYNGNTSHSGLGVYLLFMHC